MESAPPLAATPAAVLDGNVTLAERRHTSDRRCHPTPMFSRYTVLSGRRQDFRRRNEGEGLFVDRYGTKLFLVVSGIALLNILDALFTILFLSYGGREMNPIVDLSLQAGLWPFLLLKSLGIGLCVGFLTVTKNFHISRLGLGVVFGGYLALLGWHLYLLTHLPAYLD